MTKCLVKYEASVAWHFMHFTKLNFSKRKGILFINIYFKMCYSCEKYKYFQLCNYNLLKHGSQEPVLELVKLFK